MIKERHKYNIFPEMGNDDYQRLLNDIKVNGYDSKQPIYLFEDKIIDGWNRQKACNELNIEPIYVEFVGNDIDAINYIMRTNKRRNLKSSQWACIAIDSEDIVETIKSNIKRERYNKSVGDNIVSNDLFDSLKPTKTADVVAGLFNTSSTYIKSATALKNTNPELYQKVKDGTKSFNEIKHIIKHEESKNMILQNIDTGLNNKVENKDAISFLKSLEDESVSMVLTDSPYGIDFVAARNVGNETFNDSLEDTLNLLDDTCKELQRVCKDNSHLYFFTGHLNLSKFQTIIGKYFDVEPNPIVWVKNNHTMTNFSKHYANKYEFIIFAKKGDARLLNNVCSTDILEYAKPTTRIHDCEKPTELLKYLIQNSSQEGEVVCDPFGGSLSTYRAANELNRLVYTCEMDETIYKKAVNNLK